jgi:hypothetical protein
MIYEIILLVISLLVAGGFLALSSNKSIPIFLQYAFNWALYPIYIACILFVFYILNCELGFEVVHFCVDTGPLALFVLIGLSLVIALFAFIIGGIVGVFKKK